MSPSIYPVFLTLLLFASCKAASLQGSLATAAKQKASFLTLDPAILEPSMKNLPTISNSTNRCGTVLTEVENELSYKPFNQVLENERCVWVISVPGAASYNVTLAYMGEGTNQPESGQELLLTRIGYPAEGRTPELSSYKLTSPGIIEIRNASIILVAFISGNQPTVGFFLGYQATEFKSVPSRLSTSHILSESTLDFRYPVNASLYSSYELAAFVLPPRDNLYSGSTNKLWYKVHSMDAEHMCYDSLFVYKFNASAGYTEEKWAQEERICGFNTTGNVKADDILLGVFLSDFNMERSGFSLSNLAC